MDDYLLDISSERPDIEVVKELLSTGSNRWEAAWVISPGWLACGAGYQQGSEIWRAYVNITVQQAENEIDNRSNVPLQRKQQNQLEPGD